MKATVGPQRMGGKKQVGGGKSKGRGRKMYLKKEKKLKLFQEVSSFLLKNLSLSICV